MHLALHGTWTAYTSIKWTRLNPSSSQGRGAWTGLVGYGAGTGPGDWESSISNFILSSRCRGPGLGANLSNKARRTWRPPTAKRHQTFAHVASPIQPMSNRRRGTKKEKGEKEKKKEARSKRGAIGWLAGPGTSASMMHSMLRLPTCSVLHESKSQCRRPSCRRLRSIDQLAVIERRPLMVLSIVSCLVCSILALLFPALTYRGRLFDIPGTQHFEVAAL